SQRIKINGNKIRLISISGLVKCIDITLGNQALGKS
ncbi:hypothetical protein MHK_004805, partial [Candidatus Magnetomorum sp. HK-1]